MKIKLKVEKSDYSLEVDQYLITEVSGWEDIVAGFFETEVELSKKIAK